LLEFIDINGNFAQTLPLIRPIPANACHELFLVLRSSHRALLPQKGSADLLCKSAAFPCRRGTSLGPTQQVRATPVFCLLHTAYCLLLLCCQLIQHFAELLDFISIPRPITLALELNGALVMLIGFVDERLRVRCGLDRLG